MNLSLSINFGICCLCVEKAYIAIGASHDADNTDVAPAPVTPQHLVGIGRIPDKDEDMSPRKVES